MTDESRKDRKVLFKILIAILVAVVLILIINGESWYWKYWPFEPVKVHGLKIVDTGPLYPGGVLVYEIHLTKYMDTQPVVTRQLVNTYTYTSEDMHPPSRPLGENKFWSPLPIPRFAEYGKYKLRWTGAYPLNHEGRWITITMESNEFEIIPDPNEIKRLKKQLAIDDICNRPCPPGPRGARGERGEKGEPGERGEKGGFTFFGK